MFEATAKFILASLIVVACSLLAVGGGLAAVEGIRNADAFETLGGLVGGTLGGVFATVFARIAASQLAGIDEDDVPDEDGYDDYEDYGYDDIDAAFAESADGDVFDSRIPGGLSYTSSLPHDPCA